MIDPSLAETAADMLRTTAPDIGTLWAQARRKEHNLKSTEGELEKEYHAKGTPVTMCKAYARADQRWKDAAEEDAAAAGIYRALDSRRDAAKIVIGLYQSQVKDRM
jgi:hypothetical protein